MGAKKKEEKESARVEREPDARSKAFAVAAEALS
jgi:hypothetical protein